MLADPLYTPENQTQVVQDIFASIAPRYDFLNHLLSFGQDIRWRNHAVRRMHFFQTFRCLDVATGTGDVALAVSRKYPQVSITGVDFSPAMIALAQKKGQKSRYLSHVDFQHGDATCLDFPDHSFDVVIVSFGIRNIPDKKTALKEMTRVLVPGGQLMILEMVSQQERYFQKWYQTYLCKALPQIASLFSRNRKAYRYLGQSILDFPKLSDFCTMIEENRVTLELVLPMTFGITRLFIAKKDI
jgi:demethylmenaquinone methyltransferase / 2-methoxy-6-polyprenyl-1,4-benzoquinol methylase